MKACIIFFLKGMVIGLANLIPGLTLATAAFLLGSYIHILQALRALNITALRYLYERRWHDLAQHVPWRLLLMMPLGMAATVWALPHFIPVTYWQSLYKPQIYAAICGLTLGGAGFALAQHRGAGFIGLLLFFGGLFASTLPLIMPIQPLPVSWEYQFLTGMVGAFCEMIPGVPEVVSDKLTGHYEAVAYYTDRGFWPAPALFIAGILTGVLVMLSLLALLFRRAPEQTTSLLLGLASGVTLQLWPLRVMKGNSPQELSIVVTCFICGVAVSGLLQFFQRRTMA